MLIVLLALAGIVNAAIPAMAATAPRDLLRALICQRALDPGARAVAITAVMRPLRDTRRMSLRFQLLGAQQPGAAYATIKGGDLGTWISPGNPTLGRRPGDTWIVNKQVVNLAAPARYRFRVSFRWTGAHGRVLGSAVRQSASCLQPELRPDLAVESIQVLPIPTQPKYERYVVTLANHGATAAGPFQVVLDPHAGAAALTHSLPGIRAHRTVQIGFTGPLCNAAAPPTVTADPSRQVDDYNRANNSLTATCPAS